MLRRRVANIIGCLAMIVLISCSAQPETNTINEQLVLQEVQNMQLTSPAFQNNTLIPSTYTCDGKNINPPLKISDIPKEVKSLVLIIDDPDSVKPAGKVWDHWIVFNIPPSTTIIPEGKEPQGVHGKGTGGNLKYHGPCPPDAEHRYYFKLYALDTQLSLPEGSTKLEVEKSMERHIIEKTELIGRYNRKR